MQSHQLTNLRIEISTKLNWHFARKYLWQMFPYSKARDTSDSIVLRASDAIMCIILSKSFRWNRSLQIEWNFCEISGLSPVCVEPLPYKQTLTIVCAWEKTNEYGHNRIAITNKQSVETLVMINSKGNRTQ